METVPPFTQGCCENTRPGHRGRPCWTRASGEERRLADCGQGQALRVSSATCSPFPAACPHAADHAQQGPCPLLGCDGHSPPLPSPVRPDICPSRTPLKEEKGLRGLSPSRAGPDPALSSVMGRVRSVQPPGFVRTVALGRARGGIGQRLPLRVMYMLNPCPFGLFSPLCFLNRVLSHFLENYLSLSGGAGSRVLSVAFLQLQEGGYSLLGSQASHFGGFSSCRAGSGCRGSGAGLTGLAALQKVGSFWTRDEFTSPATVGGFLTTGQQGFSPF